LLELRVEIRGGTGTSSFSSHPYCRRSPGATTDYRTICEHLRIELLHLDWLGFHGVGAAYYEQRAVTSCIRQCLLTHNKQGRGGAPNGICFLAKKGVVWPMQC
jgi:hypothetical protein